MSTGKKTFQCCVSPDEYAEIHIDQDGDMGILICKDDICVGEVVLTRDQAIKIRDHITNQLRKSKVKP